VRFLRSGIDEFFRALAAPERSYIVPFINLLDKKQILAHFVRASLAGKLWGATHAWVLKHQGIAKGKE